MINRTIFAISTEESRYTLNAALLILKGETMTMVATDGHRLAHVETDPFAGERRLQRSERRVEGAGPEKGDG